MTNVDYYLTCDHDARAKTTHLSVIAGIAVGAVATQFDVPPIDVGIASIVVVRIVEVVRAWKYVQPHTQRVREDSPPFRIRRSLILAPASFLIFLAISLLPVPRIEAAVIECKLKDNAEDPLDPQNIRDTQKTLIHAEVSKVNVRPTALQEAGNKFLSAAMEDPSNRDAWNTVIAFINYKSFLNTSLSINFRDVLPTGREITTVYKLDYPIGTTPPELKGIGSVPKSESAQLLRIGHPDPDALAPLGNDWIILRKGSVTLDNMRLRRVVFLDVNVYYKGGRCK